MGKSKALSVDFSDLQHQNRLFLFNSRVVAVQHRQSNRASIIRLVYFQLYDQISTPSPSTTADRIHLLSAMDFLNLPTEIIFLITECLPSENLLQLALTCRRLSSLILPRARVATLMEAVDRDDLDRFVQVLMTNNVAIHYPLDGFTILEYVISFGAKHYLEPLFRHGVSFRPRPGSTCHSNKYSLLQLAAIQDEPESEDVLRIILKHHGDEAALLVTDDLGFTPLMAAVKTGSIGADVLLDAYLEREMDIDPPDSDHPLLLEAVLYANHNWDFNTSPT